MKNGRQSYGSGKHTNKDDAVDTFSNLLLEYESTLSSHTDSLQSLLTPTHNGESRDYTVSLEAAMGKATELLRSFRGLRIQWLKLSAATGLNTLSSPLSATDPLSHKNIPAATDSSLGSTAIHQSRRSTRKRSMASTDNGDDISALNTSRNSLEHPSKRKKTLAVDQYADEDVEDIVPVSMSSEDISEEVQQRLKQIEEKRKMRAYQQQGRKRLRADQEYTIPNDEVIPTTKRVKHPKSGEEQP